MEAIADQLMVVLGLLAVSFVGPIFAVSFLVLRKRRARARRRSPIGITLLRGPGHTLREQLEESNLDLLTELFTLSLIPLMMCAAVMAQHLVRGTASSGRASTFVALGLALFIAYSVRKLWKTGQAIDKLKVGYDAELAVGQELEHLMRQGAFVFHDFPAEGFNIDHVVIAREGVFAIETKGFTKPRRGQGRADATVKYDGNKLVFPTWATAEPLEQADRQSKWLAKWLTSAVGSPVQTTSVLALPGWFVDVQGRGLVSVFSGRQLPYLLRSSSSSLSEQDVQRIVHQVQQRCRSVAPRYADADAPRPRQP